MEGGKWPSNPQQAIGLSPARREPGSWWSSSSWWWRIHWRLNLIWIKLMVKSSCINRLLYSLAKEKNSVEDLGFGITNKWCLWSSWACTTGTTGCDFIAEGVYQENDHDGDHCHCDHDCDGHHDAVHEYSSQRQLWRNLCYGSGNLCPARCTKDSNHSAFPDINIFIIIHVIIIIADIIVAMKIIPTITMIITCQQQLSDSCLRQASCLLQPSKKSKWIGCPMITIMDRMMTMVMMRWLMFMVMAQSSDPLFQEIQISRISWWWSIDSDDDDKDLPYYFLKVAHQRHWLSRDMQSRSSVRGEVNCCKV